MARPTRIAMLAPSPAEDDAWRQATALAERLPSDEFEVHRYALASDGKTSTDDQKQYASAMVPATSLGARWPLDPLAWLRWKRELHRLRPNIIQTWGMRGANYCASVGLQALGAQHVTTIVRDEGDSPSIVSSIEQAAARRSDRVVVPHVHLQGSLASLGFATEKIAVIAPGLEPALPCPVDREAWLREQRLPRDARLIGVRGPLVRRRRLKDVLWAAELVYVLHKNSCLLIFGEGPRKDALRRFARDLNAEDRVRFLPPAAGWALLGLLDVYWSGSEREGLPLDVLDAMAAGVPVVASDIAGHRALIEPGETGFLAQVASRAEFAKATEQIFQDGSLAQRIGRSAQARAAAGFSQSAMIDRYAALYRKVRSSALAANPR